MVPECWRSGLTPGVPQISVKRAILSDSITLLRPKSQIIISASSLGSLNSKFSGLRSRWTMPHLWRYATALKMILTRSAASLAESKVIRVEKCEKHALFVVVTFGANTIEEFSTGAEIEAEVEIVGGLTEVES